MENQIKLEDYIDALAKIKALKAYMGTQGRYPDAGAIKEILEMEEDEEKHVNE